MFSLLTIMSAVWWTTLYRYKRNMVLYRTLCSKGSFMAAAPSTMPMETGWSRSGGRTSIMAAAPSTQPTVHFQLQQCFCVIGHGVFGVLWMAYQFVLAVRVVCFVALSRLRYVCISVCACSLFCCIAIWAGLDMWVFSVCLLVMLN